MPSSAGLQEMPVNVVEGPCTDYSIIWSTKFAIHHLTVALEEMCFILGKSINEVFFIRLCCLLVTT
jgi:hypothetical protein